MKSGGIFPRTFFALLLITAITVSLFTVAVTATLQSQRQSVFESEVFSQAQEVADYMAHLNQLRFVRENTTMQYIIRKKISDIHDRFNADIWIVSFSSGYGYVQYLDSSWNTSEGLASEAVRQQLSVIQQGNSVRVSGLFPELGEDIVTIGVPWRYSDGDVVGAVLLHISTDALAVNMWDVFPTLLPAALAALVLGVIVSIFLARSQTRPIREINNAVSEFTKGHLERRVSLHCGGELGQLGEAINKMAFELATLEASRKSFVASVSHELRSPLTCIQGYIQGLSDGTIPPEERQKYYKIVMDEAQRLTKLVHDLLELSRFESGKFPLNRTRFDINELVRIALIGFERRIEEKHLAVAVSLSDEPCYVNADADRIRQVLNNLIDNALKFLKDGGTLSVGAKRDGRRVEVTVADDGPGIAQEDLPFIFDRFYKADKAHTSGMGTGLGLSIVKRILDQHESEIRVRSVPGETVFCFTLAPDEGKKAPQQPQEATDAAPAVVKEPVEAANVQK